MWEVIDSKSIDIVEQGVWVSCVFIPAYGFGFLLVAETASVECPSLAAPVANGGAVA